MKTILTLFAILTLGIFITSPSVAAPEIVTASAQQTQHAPALKSWSINEGRLVARSGDFSPLVKTAKACKAAGQDCNYQACPPKYH